MPLAQRAMFHVYPLLPHRLLGALTRLLGATPWPRPIVDAVVRAWIARGAIDMREVAAAIGDFATVEAFFLRELVPGARPLGAGFVAPADGMLFAAGDIDGGPLRVKGQRIDLGKLVNGERRAGLFGRAPLHDLDTTPYLDGRHATIFLTPHGYHHVHAPLDGTLLDVQWVPGRFFPQNDRALTVIPRVYERNERAVLRLSSAAGEYLLVMVGASLIGGIELEGLPRQRWAGARRLRVERALSKGDRLGCFTFGSTVVCLLPRRFRHRALRQRSGPGVTVQVGQGLFA